MFQLWGMRRLRALIPFALAENTFPSLMQYEKHFESF